MKDQIVKIIADYLNKMEVPKEKWDGTVGFFPAEWPLPTCTIADEIAEKLAAAIAPHLEAGAGWEDAPEWAEWRTVDKGGAITFWDKEPRLSHAGYWTMQGTDGTKWEEVGQDESWKHSLQSRPR